MTKRVSAAVQLRVHQKAQLRVVHRASSIHWIGIRLGQEGRNSLGSRSVSRSSIKPIPGAEWRFDYGEVARLFFRRRRAGESRPLARTRAPRVVTLRAILFIEKVLTKYPSTCQRCSRKRPWITQPPSRRVGFVCDSCAVQLSLQGLQLPELNFFHPSYPSFFPLLKSFRRDSF